MTSTRYFIERIAQAFGYNRTTQRLSDAANEMHLLREAEAHLGEAVWQNIEPVETLSNEYWSLRKLSKEYKELQERVEECQKRLEEAEEERASLINQQAANDDSGLAERRNQMLDKLEAMARERDDVIREGSNIRRLYKGAKTKLEVLSSEGGVSEAELNNVKGRLEQLKARFTELKQQRDVIAARIQDGDAEIDLINQKLLAQSRKNQEIAAEAFKVINQANKEVWQLRAEIGLVETRMHQLHSEIGRHISRHASHDADCRKAAASQQGLVDLMRALRRSIALNHRLAGRM